MEQPTYSYTDYPSLRGPAMILLEEPDPKDPKKEVKVLGDLKSFPKVDDEQARRKERPNRLGVQLKLYPSDEWNPRIDVEIIAWFEDGQFHRDSTVVAIFDSGNLSATQAVTCEAVDQFSNEQRSELEDRWKISLDDECFKEHIDQRELYSLRIQITSDGKGQNLFCHHQFGVHAPIISTFRKLLRLDGEQNRILHFLFLEKYSSLKDTHSIVTRLNDSLNAARSQPPPLKWARIFANKDLKATKKPRITLFQQYVFSSPAFYSTIMNSAVLQEWELTAKPEIPFGPLCLRVLKLPNSDHNRLLGIVDWDRQEYHRERPRTRDVFRVQLSKPPNEIWVARVIEPLSYAKPRNQICVLLNRSAHHPDSPPFEEVEASEPQLKAKICISKLIGSKRHDMAKVAAIAPVRINITLLNDKHELIRRQEALQRLCAEKEQSRDNLSAKSLVFRQQLRETLLAKDIETLSRSNLFDSPKIPDAAVLKEMIRSNLSQEQSGLVEMLEYAPGGLTLVNGAPGTGKTSMAVTLLVAIAMHEPVLILAPINSLVDRHYQLLLEKVRKWRELYFPKEYTRPVLVIRAHYDFAEKQILLRKKAAKHIDRLNTTVTEKYTEDATDIKVAEVAMSDQEDFIAQKFTGVYDKRVQVLDGSVGWHMGRLAGIILDETGKTLPGCDWNRYLDFRKLYRSYINDPEFKKMEELNKEIDSLRARVFSEASIVCTTLSGASQKSIHDHYKPVLVVLDEAAKVSEVDANHASVWWPTARAILQIGDVAQLGPTVLVDKESDNFIPQLKLSQFERLQKCGFPTLRLLTQHRFCEDINSLVSSLAYHDELVPSASIDQAEVERARRVHDKMFGKKTNTIWIDVSSSCRTRWATQSKYSPTEVYAVCHTIDSYLSHGYAPEDIGVITPYRAQYFDLCRAIATMSRLEKRKNLRALKIGRFDEMVGDERSILIVSMVIGDEIGFLNDDRRINAAISRARFALCIIGNRSQITWGRYVRKKSLGRLVDMFQSIHRDNGKIPSYLEDLELDDE